MTSNATFWLSLLGLGLILAGCKDDQTSAVNVKVKPDPDINVPSLLYPPVSTFAQNCARCHGPQGSFFGKGFAREDETDLSQTVQDMMKGPAFLQPTGPDIAAMTAYLQSIASQKPYLCVTAWDANTASLQGQATPHAEISAVGCDDKQTTADDEGQWVLSALPDKWRGQLKADWQGKMSRLSLRQAAQ